MSGEEEVGEIGAIAVFDLAARTGRLLHPYEGVGMGGWESSPSWSPDGQWLSTYIRDQNQEQAGLWLLRPDGSEEQRLGSGTYAWSPDSNDSKYDFAQPQTAAWPAIRWLCVTGRSAAKVLFRPAVDRKRLQFWPTAPDAALSTAQT